MTFPDPIEKFIETFSKLPSIGRRQASRLAFYFLKRKNFANQANLHLKNLLEEIDICPKCFLPFQKKQSPFCEICSNNNRNQKLICIVEKELDSFSLEGMSQYKGVYHILGGLINPNNLKTYEVLGLETLKKRIKELEGNIADEIIIAVNPTTDGDLTAMYLERELKNFSKKITRLGRGIPTGGEIEFADEETLFGALENRR